MVNNFFQLDDWTMSDWLRFRRKAFRNFRVPRIYFQGFQQYGPNGESIFHTDTTSDTGPNSPSR